MRFVFSKCDRCGVESYSPHTTCDGQFHNGDGVYVDIPHGWGYVDDPANSHDKWLFCGTCLAEACENFNKFLLNED